MSNQGIDIEDLWIERIAGRLGFNTVSETLVGSAGLGPYLFIGTIIGIHLPILSVVGWIQTGVLSIAVNPGEVFQIVAWPAVVWILLRTKTKYAAIVAQLPDAIDEDVQGLDSEGPLLTKLLTVLGVPDSPSGKADARLEQLVHRPIWYLFLLIGLAFYGTQLLLNHAQLVGPVAELTGPLVATIRFYVFIPFVLYPIGAEFIAVVIGALVFLPFKIQRAKLVDFSDPHGFAGLAPAGELFKSVSVSFFILLTMFTVFQTVAVGASPSTLFSSTLLIAGALVGLLLFFGPMFWIKSFLANAKEAKVEALAERSKQAGSTDELFPYAEPDSIDDASQYTYDLIRIQRVQATSEFPLNIGMIQEILFALVLPYLMSLVFDLVLKNLV